MTTGPQATVRRLERAISRLAGDAIERMDATLPWYARDAARPAVLGRAGRAGGHRRVHRVVPRPRPRAGDHGRRVRHRPARAGPRGDPAADRRAGPGHHRGRRGRTSTSWRRPARSSCCARRCCATRARSRSPPRRCTPRPPRPAAPGTPGSRRSSSTRCCAARSTSRSGRGRPRSAGASAAGSPSSSGRARDAAPGRDRRRRPAGRPARPASTRSAACTATGWSSRSTASGTPTCSSRPGTSARSSRPGPVVVGPVVAGPRRRRRARRPRRSPACAPPPPGPARRGRSRPTHLLPERALDGDPVARRRLVDEVFGPLVRAGGDLLDTLTAYLEASGSIEGAARALFVHPNTVRYRLRRVAEVTGLAPTDPRGAFALRLALALGRLAPTRTPRFVGNLQSRGRVTSSASIPPRRTRSTQRWDGARHRRARSGRPDPRFPRPLARAAPGRAPPRLAVGRAPASTWPTTAPRPTRTRSATPPSPSRCSSRPACSPLLELFPHPADAFGLVGVGAGHTVGELTAAAGRPRHHRRAGDGARPRARPGDGRGRRHHRRPA